MYVYPWESLLHGCLIYSLTNRHIILYILTVTPREPVRTFQLHAYHAVTDEVYYIIRCVNGNTDPLNTTNFIQRVSTANTTATIQLTTSK